MIVATAGHVDHGKTTLVRALTGTDTDRAPESQARGMTIDLGFATARLDDRHEAVFIDVPGHERFIRNMLAGVAAIDLALLVVAADDGPMPQTREHLAILQLLGVPRLLVALTKVDRVDAARLAAAEAEVAGLLAGTAFTGAAVLPVAAVDRGGAAGSALDGGLAALRQQLVREAAALQARAAAGRFRLAIDRSFAVVGSGRVVTGAVLSGRLQVGDTVRLAPQGVDLRVRGLQVLNQPADAVQAGQRCAVNLAGGDLKRAEPARGDWLLDPAVLPPADRLDVLLHWLPDVQPLPGPRAQLLLHVGAATRTVRWAALAGSAQGGSGLSDPPQPMPARLVTDQPVHAAWGDRFILRDAAAGRTLAGGRVVDPAGPLRGRSQPQRLAQLAALAIDDSAASLQALLDASPAGVDLGRFASLRNLRDDEAQALFRAVPMQLPAQMADGPGGQGPRAGAPALGLSPDRWQAWRGRLLDVLDAFHADAPDRLGADMAALRQRLGDTDGSTPLLAAGLRALAAEGVVQREGIAWRRTGHQPVLPAEDAALLARVLPLAVAGGLRPPIVVELAAQLGLPVPDLLDGLQRLAGRGVLVRVAPNRFYPPAAVAGLEAEARALAAASADGRIDAAAYRDRTGIGRNLTVQVLEFLDRIGVTRFDGTHHHLRN